MGEGVRKATSERAIFEDGRLKPIDLSFKLMTKEERRLFREIVLTRETTKDSDVPFGGQNCPCCRVVGSAGQSKK